MVRSFALALALALLGGCNNPCQDMCLELAHYASNDCGFEVSSDEVQQCRADNASIDRERAEVCASENDPDAIREWWSCDDVAENFQNAAP